MADNKRNVQKNLESQYDELDRAASMWRKINEKQEQGLKINEKTLKALQKQYGSLQNLESKIDDIFDGLDKITDEVEDANKEIKKTLSNFDDIDDSLVSIGNRIGKNSGLYQTQIDKTNQLKKTINGVSSILQNNLDLSQQQEGAAIAVSQGYKNTQKSILSAGLALSKNEITQSEYNKLIQESYQEFETLIDRIDDSTESGKHLRDIFEEARKEVASLNEKAKQSTKYLQKVSDITDHIAGSGVEGMRELGNVIESAANKGKGLKLALSALAGVLAGMAYNYGLIGNKVKTIAGYDKQITGIAHDVDIINQKVGLGEYGGRNFVSEIASKNFQIGLQQMGAQFEAASKTALFGNGIGGAGYGAAQLQLAGIGAEQIAQAMQTAADYTGKMSSAKMGADMSIMAERTGQSVDNIAQINDIFQRLDKVGERTALNLQEGVRAMASKAGVNLAGAMTEIAEASKDAIGYQIKSTNQLAKQVIYAKSLGVSFNDVAKAGQNMVLNYKDSIKAEMSLSAMLGKNVNLSEVRAKFMAGDQEGAMKALQAQGLNPAQMNMFQQQALQQALGGMDLNAIQKITTRTGTTGGNLRGGNAGAGNAGFLGRKVGAEGALAVQNAIIQAKGQIQLTEIDKAQSMALQDAIINNTDGVADLINRQNQLEFLKDAETNLTAAVIGLTTAILSNGLMNMGGKGGQFGSTIATQAAAQGGRMAAGKAVLGAAAKSGGAIAGGLIAAATEGYGEWTKNKAAGMSTGQNVGRTSVKAAGAGGGAWGGAALGASIGTMIFPGVGTVIGGLIGSIGGAMAGSKLADVTNDAIFSKKATEAPKAEVIQKTNKPTTTAVKETTKATQQVKAAQETAIKEVQYTGKIQNEMVALLATNAQLLEEIMNNTSGQRAIQLNGKKVNETLLNQNRKTYAIARNA